MKAIAIPALAMLVLLSCTLSPARASGGFSCSVDDDHLRFAAESAMGRGNGSPFLNLQASAETKIKGTPIDLAQLDLKANLVHSWMDHPDLRLHFYWEREGDKPHATFELLVRTVSSDDEGTYSGTYDLTIFYTEKPADAVEGAYLRATGQVSCFVE